MKRRESSFFSNPYEKKWKTFTIPDGVKEIAKQNILIRAIVKKHDPENFSEYIRNLIQEDYERNQKIYTQV